jgi:hypothetical protein
VDALTVRRAAVLAALVDPALGDPTLGDPEPNEHRGRILPPEVVDAEVRLATELTGIGTFTERLTLEHPDGRPLVVDPTDPAVAGALQVLALTTAVSYLKATLPPRVEVPPGTGPAARRMLGALLGEGLAELAHAQGLGDLAGRIALEGDAAAPAARPPLRPGVLVTVGGGKDSAVVLATAAAQDPDALAVAVNPRGPMERTATWAGVGLVRIHRRLDPGLLELNARGAINGHVPITAIVTSAAVLAAAALGRGTVLVANEASADAPTRWVDGRAVNHQYSKTTAFEGLLAAALTEVGAGVRVVSLIRPLGELAVARAAAALPGLTAAVTSCNAAFSLTAPTATWCGACPKCRFVQLALAPFVPRARLVADLGFDALADAAQVDGFAALLDPATRPFECVGTIEESRLALELLADDPAWADAAAVAALAAPSPDAPERAARRDRLAAALAVDPTVVLPPPFDTWVAGIAGAAAGGPA